MSLQLAAKWRCNSRRGVELCHLVDEFFSVENSMKFSDWTRFVSTSVDWKKFSLVDLTHWGQLFKWDALWRACGHVGGRWATTVSRPNGYSLLDGSTAGWREVATGRLRNLCRQNYTQWPCTRIYSSAPSPKRGLFIAIFFNISPLPPPLLHFLRCWWPVVNGSVIS